MKIELTERPMLYQWDLNRQVKIMLPEGTQADEVHFAHPLDKEALVVRIKDVDGMLVADIPNILLQSDQHIRVWLVSGDRTIYGHNLAVFPRIKPADYVYTETEILRYENLEKRIATLEKDFKEFKENGNGGGIKKETDPTIPAWAKEPEKPKYTAEEVGAASKEDVRNLSEEIDKLKDNQPVGNSGVTTVQANSLWSLLRKAAFTEPLTEEELNVFKTAWGIEDVTLYPLTNGTHTFTDGTVVAVTNGNHVAITFGEDNIGSTIVLSNIVENGEELVNSNALNPPSTWFILKPGDEINIAYSNFNLNSSSENVAIGFKKTGTPDSVSGLSVTYPNTSVSQTITENVNIGNAFLFTSEARSGDTIEFDVSITVNGIKYV